MGHLFSIDSPLMRKLSKVADLMILNLLVILTSIPIITFGASMSAMHYVLIKISRNEGTSVAQMYFKSFKENFAQGTVLWIVNILALIVVGYDLSLFLFTETTMPLPLFVCVIAVGVLFLMTCMYFYPLQARFVNPVSKTIRNSFFVMVLNFPKSILMVLLYLLPVAVLFVAFFAIPLVILFGFTAPGYGAVMLYRKVFEKLENNSEQITEDMDFHLLDGEQTGDSGENEGNDSETDV